jgi:L-threonylcarbamoyladenylate synthase
VLEDVGGRVDMVVDGGPCAVGVESTVLDLTREPPRLLRPGGLPVEDIERLIGHIDVDRAVVSSLKPEERPGAPGMKYRHYAPRAPVTVITGSPMASAREIAGRAGPSSGVICFDEYAHLFPQQVVRSLGPSSDKLIQAQRVFEALRSFDSSDVTEIFAQCPDNRGLGLAIGNRLKKAAGFRVINADSQRIILGITGGTGAGKSSALQAVRDLGGTVIDCDEVYHRILNDSEDFKNAINEKFPGVFTAEGQLNRKKLGQEVFAKRDRLDQLNVIVYRFLLPELEGLVEAADGLCALDAINLFESGLDRLCDHTVAVTAPTELRVKRIMARDHITEGYARLRINAQKQDEYYRGKCDCELNNATDSPEEFRRDAYLFFERLVEAIQEEKRHG